MPNKVYYHATTLAAAKKILSAGFKPKGKGPIYGLNFDTVAFEFYELINLLSPAKANYFLSFGEDFEPTVVANKDVVKELQQELNLVLKAGTIIWVYETPKQIKNWSMREQCSTDLEFSPPNNAKIIVSNHYGHAIFVPESPIPSKYFRMKKK